MSLIHNLTTDAGSTRELREGASVLRWRVVATARDLAARLGILGHVQRLQSFRADRRRAEHAQTFVPQILANVSASSGEAGRAHWRADEIVHTVSDVTVLAAGPPQAPFEALIKVAETPAAAEGLRWQRQTLRTLVADERLGEEWRALLPRVLDGGETGGSVYLVESRVSGLTLEHALRDPAGEDSALRNAVHAIGTLHAATAREATIGPEHLDRWVGEPARTLAEVANHSRARQATRSALDRVSGELCEALEHLPITVSWVHGDYGPGNILMGPDGKISGIVDWEFAQPEDFPSLDVVTLLLTVRMFVRRQELGRVVCDLIANPVWTPSEAELVASAPDARTCESIGVARVVLLCWLRHTAWMITRCSRYGASGLWLHTNMHTVLDSLQPPL